MNPEDLTGEYYIDFWQDKTHECLTSCNLCVRDGDYANALIWATLALEALQNLQAK